MGSQEVKVEKAKAVPNYDIACESCGATPTVDIFTGGKLVSETGLCGACTWGEADCIDPDNW